MTKLATHTESGHERSDFDWYPTEPWITAGALDKLTLRGEVLEPACGDGAMARILREAGYRTWATDIHDHGYDGLDGLHNFLDTPPLDAACGIRTIFTNPPFGERGKLAEAFVRHALKLMMPVGGMVAMFLRVDFDSARTRSDLFERCPHWSRKLVLTSRAQFFAGEYGGKKNHAFFVWDALHGGPPTIDYINKPKVAK
ncbi:hypothetical protein [Azospirillum sp. TSO5]|uniref:hypothetical protein n=1 Tax=Azospirillum sp. TSO5 TaxID=716760 RepID=UPI000D65D359|nr:hypothetical protein [Azospirillum sp. TSO5]